MAFGGTYYGPGSPRFEWNVTWAETGRNATQVTYRVTAKTRLQHSTSYYGYNINMKATINGTSKTVSLSTTKWTGTAWRGPWTFDITTSANGGGGTHNASFETSSSNGGGNACKINITGTTKYSTWNTAPTVSGYVTIRENNSSGRVISAAANGTENANKFPENVSNLYLSWPAASDKEGGTITYEVWRQISESAWSKIHTTTATNYTNNIGSGNQGASYDYSIKAYDNYGTYASNEIPATQVQKNQFTKANISLSGSIGFSTASINRTYSGAKNTNGNTTFTYSLSCKIGSTNITVYNPANTSSTITIYRSGTAPSTTYIKFDDIKKAVASSNYKGTATFTLKTTNAYGSSGTATASASIDLQQNITINNTVTIHSSSYTSINGVNYVVGNLGNVRLDWGAATDALDQNSIRYKLEYSTNNGSSWSTVSGASSLTATNYTTAINNTSGNTYKFRVTASNNYGKSSVYGSQPSVKVYYYNAPEISFTSINRTSNKVEIKFNVTLKTNLPNNEVVRVYAENGHIECDEVINNTIKPTTRTVNFSGLSESETFVVTVVIDDTIGKVLKKQGVASKTIEAYESLLFLRNTGLGIFVDPTTTSALAVKGIIELVDQGGVRHQFIKPYAGNSNGFGVAIQTGGSVAIGGGEAAQSCLNGVGSSYDAETLYLVSDNKIVISPGVQNGWDSRTSEIVYSGKLLTFNTYSTDATSGIKLVGSSGTTGSWWSGTGGTVLQSVGNANLHLGKANSTDMIFYSDRIETKKQFKSLNKILIEYDTPTNGAQLSVNTSYDKNGQGDQMSHIGYNSNGIFHHYFRGKGVTNVNTDGGLSVTENLYVTKNINSGYSINVGKYEEAFRSINMRRATSGQSYDARYGVSFGTIKKASGDANHTAWGAVIEAYNANTNNADRRFLFSQTGFYPLSDNNSYCGASSHRFQAMYASTGTVYSCSKDEKENITPIMTNPYARDAKTSNRLDIITKGLKDLNLYTYQYKTLDNHESNNFVGFLGQEVEQSNPEFFNLFGSSCVKETEDGETVQQYDIREASLNGVLLAGLGEALRKIEELEKIINNKA